MDAHGALASVIMSTAGMCATRPRSILHGSRYHPLESLATQCSRYIRSSELLRSPCCFACPAARSRSAADHIGRAHPYIMYSRRRLHLCHWYAVCLASCCCDDVFLLVPVAAELIRFLGLTPEVGVILNLATTNEVCLPASYFYLRSSSTETT